MPDITTRRVNVTFTFATDVEADHVMRRALESLPDDQAAVLETVSVHAFDLDEDAEGSPVVHLVLGAFGIRWADTPETAEGVAASSGGVVVELPITSDYRKDTR